MKMPSIFSCLLLKLPENQLNLRILNKSILQNESNIQFRHDIHAMTSKHLEFSQILEIYQNTIHHIIIKPKIASN